MRKAVPRAKRTAFLFQISKLQVSTMSITQVGFARQYSPDIIAPYIPYIV
jgi:hypothetical protein